jgi:hypothetical protein
MNGVLDSQVSGNDWRVPPPDMLYQISQESAPQPALATQGSILQDFEQQMVQFETDHREIVGEVRRSYVLPNDTSVTEFFRSHRTIPQLLVLAASHLQEYFGAGIVLTLRATIDEYGSQTLYAVVMWPGAVRDVRDALANFDDYWWIANSRQAGGDLTFTYELV